MAAAALNPEQRPDPGLIKTTDVEVQTVSGDTETVRLHSTFWPGMEWAFAHDAEVWLALADPDYTKPGTVDYVLIETPRGEVFFPGYCLDGALRIPLHEALGPDSDQLLAGLPLVEPGKAREYLGIEEPTPEEPHPDRVIPNPDTVDASVSEKGWHFNAYIDDSGELEFWLLNGDGDVSKPFGKIGEVDTRGKGITVVVDTSKIDADGTVKSDDLVTLVD